jgi:hypothetical protein
VLSRSRSQYEWTTDLSGLDQYKGGPASGGQARS